MTSFGHAKQLAETALADLCSKETTFVSRQDASDKMRAQFSINTTIYACGAKDRSWNFLRLLCNGCTRFVIVAKHRTKRGIASFKVIKEESNLHHGSLQLQDDNTYLNVQCNGERIATTVRCLFLCTYNVIIFLTRAMYIPGRCC